MRLIQRGDIVSCSDQLWRVRSIQDDSALLWNVFSDMTVHLSNLVYVGADSLTTWADPCFSGTGVTERYSLPLANPEPKKRTAKKKPEKVDRIETKDVITSEVTALNRPKRPNSVVDGTDGDDFVPEPFKPRQSKW